MCECLNIRWTRGPGLGVWNCGHPFRPFRLCGNKQQKHATDHLLQEEWIVVTNFSCERINENLLHAALPAITYFCTRFSFCNPPTPPQPRGWIQQINGCMLPSWRLAPPSNPNDGTVRKSDGIIQTKRWGCDDVVSAKINNWQHVSDALW